MTDAIMRIIFQGEENFDRIDRQVLKWQYKMHGHFFTALFEATMRADLVNQRRLKLGFPDEVEGYLRWTTGDLAERVKTAVRQIEKREKDDGK
jgi:hypothetical protein